LGFYGGVYVGLLDLALTIFIADIRMEETEYFLTVAGLALALAGFSGLVANFRRVDVHWKPQDIAGLRYIFEHAFGACFFALLPFPVYYSGAAGPLLWKVCGGFLALYLLVELAIQLVRITRSIRRLGVARGPI
jgi:hypothetical protein